MPVAAPPAVYAIDPSHAWVSSGRLRSILFAASPYGACGFGADGGMVVARPSFGYSAYGPGEPPQPEAGAFAHSATPFSAAKWRWGSPDLTYPGLGWGSAGSSIPRPAKTDMLVTFKFLGVPADCFGLGNISYYRNVVSSVWLQSNFGIGVTTPGGSSANGQLTLTRGTATFPFTGV